MSILEISDLLDKTYECLTRESERVICKGLFLDVACELRGGGHFSTHFTYSLPRLLRKGDQLWTVGRGIDSGSRQTAAVRGGDIVAIPVPDDSEDTIRDHLKRVCKESEDEFNFHKYSLIVGGTDGSLRLGRYGVFTDTVGSRLEGLAEPYAVDLEKDDRWRPDKTYTVRAYRQSFARRLAGVLEEVLCDHKEGE